MRNYRIAPSTLSANFGRLGEEVKRVIDAGADIAHFDVMDNHYVPNLTIGPGAAIRPLITAVTETSIEVVPRQDYAWFNEQTNQ